MKFLNRFKRKSDIEQPLINAPERPLTGSQNPALRPAVYPQKRTQPDSDEVRLELGDFMHRIPPHLLAEGPHDLAAELRFEIRDLSDRISNGQTTISVSEIYKRLPQIFRGEIRASDNIEVRFPWQKLAKLVSLSGPTKNGTLQPDAAAGALAERLRAKHATSAQPAPTQEHGKTAPPILPGRGDQSVAWFSRPTAEHPKDPADQAPPATRHAGLPNASQESAPKHQGATEPSAKAMIQEIREPDMPQDLQRKLASSQDEYEHQFAELEKQRRNLIEARDASNNELLRLRQTLEATQETLAEEKTATAVSHEMLVKSASERDAMQAALDKQLAEISALRDQSKLDELTAERDALLQQKAYLSSQVSEMGKRGAHLVSSPINAHSHAPGARQLEEAQRRITGLEASQRETALELSREKEARSKVEKILIAAEKVQEQSANYMESTKAEIRREIEASVKQREIEMRKTQKDLQDQIAALSDQARKAATELENTRNRAAMLEQRLTSEGHAPLEAQPDPLQAQAVAQLEADIEQYRERLKSLITERDAARVEAEQARSQAPAMSADPEALAKANAEIQKLREAQSQLVASHTLEREGLLGEKNTLTGKIKSETDAREELFTTLDQDHTSVVRANEDLTRRLAETEKALHAMDAERVEAATTNRGQGGDPLVAELEKLNQQHAEALVSRDEALAQAKNALKESDKSQQNLATEQQQLLAELAHEREQIARLKQNLQTLTGEIAHLRQQHNSPSNPLTSEHASLSANLDGEQNKTTQLAEQLAAAEAHTAALRDQLASAVHAHETALEEKHKLLATLADLEKSHTSALLSVTQERDQARAEREALGAELSGARKQHQHLIVSFEEDRAALSAARETIQKKVGALEQQRSELTGNLQSRENLIAELESKHREAHEAHESSNTQLENKLHSLAQQLEASQSAHTDAQRVASAQIEEFKKASADADQRQTQAHSELEQLRKAHAETLDELHSKAQHHAEAATLLENERAQHAAARTDLDNLSRRLAESESALATGKAAHEHTEKTAAARLEAATHEIGQLRKAHEDAIGDLLLKEQLHTDVATSLDSEREKHTSTRSELDNLSRRLTESEATLFSARAAQQQAEHTVAESTEKARAQIERATSELQSAHQLHRDAAATLDGERALHAATRAQLEDLSHDLARNAAEAQAKSAAAAQELEQLHKTAEAAAHEHQQKLAALEHRAAEMDAKAKADLDDLRVALQIARRERDETRHESDSTINELQNRARTAEETISGLQSSLENATHSRDEALADLKTIRTEHAIAVRHRDDLAGKITRIGEHHRRLLEDLGTGEPPEPATPRHQTPAMPVIEVNNPEIFAPEPGSGIALPRFRPVPIPPPRVQSQ